jgi:6-phosphogluconolactonase/glucosamine-6-phosphate isomerase/deaminase
MYISRTTQLSQIVEACTTTIQEALKSNKDIVWLLSGGSCIELEVQISKILTPNNNITVLLVDERFGGVGHNESNWAKLVVAGFCFDKFRSHATLTGQDISTTTNNMCIKLDEMVRSKVEIFAVIGIGSDGHTAGLLPSTQALDSKRLYDHYFTEAFERLTITPLFFQYIDHAIVYTEGNIKLTLLQELIESGQDFHQKPMHLLKKCKNVLLYNKH